LLSVVLGLIFLAVPRLRRYAIPAAIAPAAFAACSIVGVFGTVLLAERLGVDRALGFDKPVEGSARIVIFFAVYGFSGVVGTAVAVSVANRIQRRLFG
jgi:hypothetical protein